MEKSNRFIHVIRFVDFKRFHKRIEPLLLRAVVVHSARSVKKLAGIGIDEGVVFNVATHLFIFVACVRVVGGVRSDVGARRNGAVGL
jgi:hypothetical protein